MTNNFYGSFKQDDGSNGKRIQFHRFYNGCTVTMDRYNRINKARLLRRAVINKKNNL